MYILPTVKNVLIIIKTKSPLNLDFGFHLELIVPSPYSNAMRCVKAWMWNRSNERNAKSEIRTLKSEIQK